MSKSDDDFLDYWCKKQGLTESRAMDQKKQIVHEKKCWSELFEAISVGEKCADIRRDDASPPYEVGHYLLMREYMPGPNDKTNVQAHTFRDLLPCDGRYCGGYIKAKIIHVLRNFPGIEPGYCVLSLSLGNNYAGFDGKYAGRFANPDQEELRQMAIKDSENQLTDNVLLDPPCQTC